MSTKIYFILVCFILSMWAGVFSAEASDGNSTEYDTAIKILREKSGDREREEALKLFIQGCDKNHVGSCLEAGSLSLYLTDSTPADYIKAEEYFAKACSLDSALACLYLGFNYYYMEEIMFNRDLGLTVDIDKAVSYFEQACEKGEPQGCSIAAEIYYNGKGIGVDKDKALTLASKGCDEYKYSASCNIKRTLEEEQKYPVLFTQYEDDCERDDAMACLTLADAYFTGNGPDEKAMPVDIKKAEEYYIKSCDRNLAKGCNKAAGFLINIDEYTEAEKYSAKSCELKDPYGCFLSGKYRFEIFTDIKNDKNAAIGMKELEKSCNLGFAEGCALLGDMYYYASEMLLSVKKNDAKALHYYIKSCNLVHFSEDNNRAHGCAKYIEIKAGDLIDSMEEESVNVE